jgi:hypothetical protein
MDIIDLALQMKDFEWAKQLQEENLNHKKVNDVKIDYASLHKQVESDSKYNNSAIALEDITSVWLIKLNNGVRNLNFISEIDRTETEILIAEKDKYNKNEMVKYYIPDFETQCYLKGYIQGIYQQYLNNQNNDILLQYKELADLYKATLDIETKRTQYYKNEYDSLTINKSKKWYKFWK